jgi:hypothetical protein
MSSTAALTDPPTSPGQPSGARARRTPIDAVCRDMTSVAVGDGSD